VPHSHIAISPRANPGASKNVLIYNTKN
jgi:hypothetical protein